MIHIQKTYSTSAVAKLIGIHPNTVRLYEDWGFITPPVRKENGYRVYTQLQIGQFRLARYALQIEVLQNGLRKKVIEIVKTAAVRNFDGALLKTDEYTRQLCTEANNADEAVKIVKGMTSNAGSRSAWQLRRKEVSQLLDITMDTLRNWEMNGLLKIRRKKNGYRVYTDDDINHLKIIRTLRCANYSLSAILRMLNALDKDRNVDIGLVLNSPQKDEDIITACDKLAISLNTAKGNAERIRSILLELKNEFSNPPL